MFIYFLSKFIYFHINLNCSAWDPLSNVSYLMHIMHLLQVFYQFNFVLIASYIHCVGHALDRTSNTKAEHQNICITEISINCIWWNTLYGWAYSFEFEQNHITTAAFYLKQRLRDVNVPTSIALLCMVPWNVQITHT